MTIMRTQCKRASRPFVQSASLLFRPPNRKLSILCPSTRYPQGSHCEPLPAHCQPAFHLSARVVPRILRGCCREITTVLPLSSLLPRRGATHFPSSAEIVGQGLNHHAGTSLNFTRAAETLLGGVTCRHPSPFLLEIGPWSIITRTWLRGLAPLLLDGEHVSSPVSTPSIPIVWRWAEHGVANCTITRTASRPIGTTFCKHGQGPNGR